jgi:hypothetical protein
LSKNRGYSGRYKLKNKSKYVGDKLNIYYRSLWERSFCKWCDTSRKVVKWAIEPFSIPYFDRGTNKNRRYNPDFYIEMEDGKKFLIEIKPDYETKPPKMRKGTKKYILAEQTYQTNQSKWYSAIEYCKQKGWSFKVVTEYTLEQMGIKILSKPRKKRKKVSKKKVKFTNISSSGKKKINKSCQ